MNYPNNNQNPEKDMKVSIINAVKTPLGFFVLVVLLVEVVLGVTASMSSGNDRTILIVGMLILIFLLVIIVAWMAYYRPGALYGVAAPTSKNTLSKYPVLESDKNKAKIIADLKKFFGNDILTENFKIVHGTFTKASKDAKPIYQKIYRDGTKFEMLPPDMITTLNTVHALSYFLQEFSKFREHPFTILTDTDALSLYHNHSFLSISGPLSNELTDIALSEPNNNLLKFEISKGEQGAFGLIASLTEEKRFQTQLDEIGSDYGLILKLRNNRNAEKNIFICAGLQRQGTSAAVWYLTNRWKKLYEEFGTNEFGIVIKVSREQDNLATPVYSVSK